METRKWRMLAGFFTTDSVLQYLEGEGVPKDDMIELGKAATKAQEYVQEIRQPRDLGGIIEEVPEDVRASAEEIVQSERDAGNQALNLRVGMLDPRTLICAQPHLDLTYVESLCARTPAKGDLKSTFEFCLPTKPEDDEYPAVARDPNGTTYSIVFDRLDIQVLAPLQGMQGDSHHPFVGFVLGAGSRSMRVAKYNGRLLVTNGHHRAVALVAKGHDRIPVVLFDALSWIDTCLMQRGFFPQELLIGPKPPVIGDFLTPAVVDSVRPALKTVVTVSAIVQHVPL
jgi:hypothetical protein